MTKLKFWLAVTVFALLHVGIVYGDYLTVTGQI